MQRVADRTSTLGMATATAERIRVLTLYSLYSTYYIPVFVYASSVACLYYLAWFNLVILRIVVVSPVRLARKSTALLLRPTIGAVAVASSKASARYFRRRRRAKSAPNFSTPSTKEDGFASTSEEDEEPQQQSTEENDTSVLLRSRVPKIESERNNKEEDTEESECDGDDTSIQIIRRKNGLNDELNDLNFSDDHFAQTVLKDIPSRPFTKKQRRTKWLYIQLPFYLIRLPYDLACNPSKLFQIPLSLVRRPFFLVRRLVRSGLNQFESIFSPSIQRGRLSAYLFVYSLYLLFKFATFHMSVRFGREVLHVSTRSLTRYYESLPLKSMSRMWGRLNALTIPVWLRVFVFTIYSRIYGVKVHEAKVEDLKHYRNLSQFFRRSLKPGVRPVDESALVTSPADGTVLYLGPVQDDLLEQVKGVTYTLESFLGPQQRNELPQDPLNEPAQYTNDSDDTALAENSTASFYLENSEDGSTTLENSTPSMENSQSPVRCQDLLQKPSGTRLYQCIVYLDPGDYHHFHSPCDWTVQQRRHFPGSLFSVQPRIAGWLAGLFAVNERAVYTGTWEHGFFAFSPVGAVNVGSINMTFDHTLVTNTTDSYIPGSFSDLDFPEGHKLKKGQHVGEFNMGSTIVLIFEAPENFEFTVNPLDKVQYGQKL